jgi:glutamyl-tRNA synthetase
MIRGKIDFPNEDLDDFVMIRTSGVPTYNFVVVIDDVEMKISHVIRGDDHINNTPKQIYLYDALKATKPLFAHLPMILGQDKKKLSKRNGETSTNAYRTEGDLLVRLGWSHGDQEVFSMQEMIDLFDLAHVQVSGAVFNTEKLMWIAGEHMRTADPVRLLSIVKSDFKDKFTDETFALLDTAYAKVLIPLIQVKVKLVKELAEQLQPLLDTKVASVDASGLKWKKDPAQKAKIKEAILAIRTEIDAKVAGKTFPSESGFDHAGVDALLRATAEKFGLKLGDLTAPMRLFVTGQAVSAIGLFDLIPAMPWKVTLARLQACLDS